MIKIIYFDAAGTLFFLPRGVGCHYAEVAARFGCRLEEQALRQAFGRVWREMPGRPAIRQQRADDDRGWWRELVGRVLDQCQVSEGDLPRDAYFDEVYREFVRPGVWELYPEVKAVLGRLRSRYRLGVISNFDGRLRPILEHLGLEGFFDPVVISSEVGADKPDPWIFEQAVARAGVAASAVLHAGDDPVRDWEGAAAAGLQVFRLDRRRNSFGDLEGFLETLG